MNLRRRVLIALPDAVAAALYLWCWIAPLAWQPKLVALLVLVLLSVAAASYCCCCCCCLCWWWQHYNHLIPHNLSSGHPVTVKLPALSDL